MTKKEFLFGAGYTAPALMEVKASIERGFELSTGFSADDYTEGENDWLS